MAEIGLSRKQMKALANVASEHSEGYFELRSPPEGTLFDRSYVEFKAFDPEGNLVDKEVFSHAGVRPRGEAIPPEWGTSDD